MPQRFRRQKPTRVAPTDMGEERRWFVQLRLLGITLMPDHPNGDVVGFDTQLLSLLLHHAPKGADVLLHLYERQEAPVSRPFRQTCATRLSGLVRLTKDELSCCDGQTRTRVGAHNFRLRNRVL